MSISSSRFLRVIDWIERRVNLTELFSMLTMFGLFYTEVDTSKPIAEALREAFRKPMPSYSRWPRVLGLLALILFLFEVVTGVLLAFYYRPTPDEAYESVLIIVRDVDFGWFVRQIHIWGAQLLIVILIARLLRFFFRGMYRPPRELIWIVAALLLITATHLDFTGRFLAWNNDFYWPSLRAMELLFSIPLIGSIFEFFIPGLEGHSYVLSRFYFLHVVLLPFMFWLLLYANFSGIRRVGLSEIRGEDTTPGKHTFVAHLYTLLILVIVIFGILVTLSVLAPVPFGEPVNLFETPSDIRMPWYLLAPYGFVEFFPTWLPLSLRSSLLVILLMIFIFLPEIDRRAVKSQARRTLVLGVNIFLFLLWIFFTIYGRLLDIGE